MHVQVHVDHRPPRQPPSQPLVRPPLVPPQRELPVDPLELLHRPLPCSREHPVVAGEVPLHQLRRPLAAGDPRVQPSEEGLHEPPRHQRRAAAARWARGRTPRSAPANVERRVGGARRERLVHVHEIQADARQQFLDRPRHVDRQCSPAPADPPRPAPRPPPAPAAPRRPCPPAGVPATRSRPPARTARVSPAPAPAIVRAPARARGVPAARAPARAPARGRSARSPVPPTDRESRGRSRTARRERHLRPSSLLSSSRPFACAVLRPPRPSCPAYPRTWR